MPMNFPTAVNTGEKSEEKESMDCCLCLIFNGLYTNFSWRKTFNGKCESFLRLSATMCRQNDRKTL